MERDRAEKAEKEHTDLQRKYTQTVARLQIRAEKAEAQVKTLVEALSDLKSQVDKFCETEGEADFYPGKAKEALAKIKEES